MNDGSTVVFIDQDGGEHHRGDLCAYFPAFAGSLSSPPEPPSIEPIIQMSDLDAIFDFMRDRCPNGWTVEDGKVVVTGNPVSKFSYTENGVIATITADTEREMASLIKSGKRIEAIKTCRRETNCSLLAGKRIMDQIAEAIAKGTL